MSRAAETDIARVRSVRRVTEALLGRLDVEDVGLQAEPDVSPPKWHAAHTTWFFEVFVLQPFLEGFTPSHRGRWHYLFNSYYEAAGARHPRPRRGELSRPRLAEVLAWRAEVDAGLDALLADLPPEHAAEVGARVALGLQHEQQHQELLLMDTKVNFHVQPLQPAYQPEPMQEAADPGGMGFLDHPGGVVGIGAEGEGFCFDNETPRHQVLLPPFHLADRLVTNGEWRAFVEDGGYRTASLWLSDGWAWVQAQGITGPRYWQTGGEGTGAPIDEFTLRGLAPLDPYLPVTHVSGYEAEAFAAWAGARLPTEHEWEAAVAHWGCSAPGAFLDDDRLHPAPAGRASGLRQALGDVWEWTRSAYLPYPGFRPLPGALGEYNGKFMSGQWVLRGGSCVTPRDHVRPTYRNFFQPQQRWPFTGVRLAKDAT